MSGQTDRPLIEAAIAAQEELRGTVGDAVADAAISALRAQLDAVSPDRSIEHERRLVTVLFMDIVDSTLILRGVDPEETMSIMDAALEVLAGPVREHGGRVTRFMGDGFLAVFGLRRTRENDAEMAVRAGLGILESARTVAEDVARGYGIADFEVRVGINTGLVVTGGVTEAEDTVMGSAVNLAARIESAAPPGGLLVSQSTYRQVRGRFDLEPAGRIDAKGFAETVPVHRVTSERLEGPYGVARGTDDILVEMVGRSDELRTLFESVEHVATSGEARIVTIVGEAGLGKSRLLAEFGSRLPPDPPVIVFRAHGSLERVDVPHSLLRDLVERSFDIRSDAPMSVVRSKLAAGFGPYLADDSSRTAKIEVVGRLFGYRMFDGEPPLSVAHTPQQLRDLAVVHLIEFFRGVAAFSPVVLLLDDLQWADESSLAVVADVLEELESHPILTVALTRSLPSSRRVRWEGLPNHLLIPLEPLSGEESELLIDSILSNIDECPPELRARLLEHAGGNPYYLEELVMMCIDDGVIAVDDGAWSVHMDRLAALRVPTTLTGVIG
ncbi:MAG: adenylate/guanylate cyclase domain-containing protein, partial [Acidimicrobiia bacterium]